MNNTSFFLYLLVMAGSTYLVRTIPFVLMKKKVTNRFWKSFLYYIPYAVLAAMTIPGALYATGNIWTAVAGLVVATLVSLKKDNLLLVALSACAAALLTGMFI